MSSIFDEKFDRSKGNARKWDKDIIAEKFHIESSDAIPMDLADFDFKTAPAVVEAIKTRAGIEDYSYTFISDDFYKSVINWNKELYNVHLEKDWIKLTYGTVSTLHYLVQALTNINDCVMFHTPVYAPFYEAVINNGREAIFSPLLLRDNRYFMDFEKMEEAFKVGKIKLFILCNPQNPSGRIWSKEELMKFSDLCIKYNIIVISDEIHRDLVFHKENFTSLWNAHPEIEMHSILCCSPNKSFNLGGLKTSYVVIKNEKLREKILNHLKSNSITSPNIFAVPATIAAYNDSRHWLSEMVEYVEKNQKYIERYIQKHLPKFYVMPSESSFLSWIYVGKLLKDDKMIEDFFQEARICPVKGSYFVDNADGYVRLSIGMNRDLLTEALERMKKVYTKLA